MAYETGEEFTKSVLKRWRGHSRSAPARGDAVRDQAPACLRQRSEADRRRMVQGDRVPDRDRPQVRRQAPGVHPRLRRDGREHAGRRHQQPPRRRRDAEHGRRPVPHSGRAGGRAWRQHGRHRARHPVLRHRDGARASTAGRSRARSSTCGRPTAKASTRSSAAPPSPGCAASTAPRPTAPMRSAPSRRSATRSRWTARSAR